MCPMLPKVLLPPPETGPRPLTPARFLSNSFFSPQMAKNSPKSFFWERGRLFP